MFVQVPSITEWIKSVLTASDDIVAADPTLFSTNQWLIYKQELGIL